jgi:ribosome-associated toxin RatA of RatAB toxin-antitoxin module
MRQTKNRERFRDSKKSESALGSEIHFLIDFSFKNRLLSAVAGVAFGFVAARMAEAFVQRADSLYAHTS